MGVEAVSYSIMMSRVALVYYIDGLVAFCRAKLFAVPLPLLEQHKRELMTAIFEIAADAGCPE